MILQAKASGNSTNGIKHIRTVVLQALKRTPYLSITQLGGEFNPDQKIRRDPIQIFTEAYSNIGVGYFAIELQPADNESFTFYSKKNGTSVA
jgi:hypothetical protein